MTRLWAVAPIGVAAVVGGLVAWWAAYHLLPNGSNNLDELVYLSQAEAIRHGQLTYDASDYVPDFRPYLSGVADDRVVFKYQPLWPAWLALAQIVTGDHRPALVVAGAAAALAFWMLGRELTGSEWLGAALAVGVVASPLFAAHSGTALAYLPAAALAAAVLAAVMRGVRTGSTSWLAAGGLGLGALFFHRPFDAALIGGPLVVWLAFRARDARRWRTLVVVALATAPFLVAWLGYNQVATGDPLTPAFSVDAPSDRFGFGRRASWEATGETFVDGAVDYAVPGALRTVGVFATYTPLWITGGVVSLALIGVATRRSRLDARRRVLLWSIVLVVVGHFFWWGTENFVKFGLHTSLGPAYWMVGLGPAAGLATLGARDVVNALRSNPRQTRLLVAGATSFAVMTVAGVVYLAVRMEATNEARSARLAAVDAAPAGTVLLFPTGVEDPFLRVLVPADLDGTPRLHAVDLESPDQRFRLRDRFPERSLWAWLQERPAGTMLDAPRRYELGELPELRTPLAVVDIDVDREGARVAEGWIRTLDSDGREMERMDLDHAANRGPAVAIAAAGSDGSEGNTLDVGFRPGWLAAGVTLVQPDGERESLEVRWMVRARGGQLDVVGPGFGYRFYVFPETTAWLREDVSARLVASIDGLAAFRPVHRIEPFS